MFSTINPVMSYDLNVTVIILLTGIKRLNGERRRGEGQSFSSFLSQPTNLKNNPRSHGAKLLWKKMGGSFLQLICSFSHFAGVIPSDVIRRRLDVMTM